MTKIAHRMAGGVALALILTFWLSTVFAEVFLDSQWVIAVKTAIPYGFLLLIPALAATGGSGFRLAGGRRTGLIGTKAKRMKIAAANGTLVLVPAALFLAFRAQAGQFDGCFFAVQFLELLAGAVNITLLGLNMRDGFRLAGRHGGKRNRQGGHGGSVSTGPHSGTVNS